MLEHDTPNWIHLVVIVAGPIQGGEQPLDMLDQLIDHSITLHLFNHSESLPFHDFNFLST